MKKCVWKKRKRMSWRKREAKTERKLDFNQAKIKRKKGKQNREERERLRFNSDREG